MHSAQKSYRDVIYSGMDGIADKYKAGFDELRDMSAVQSRLAQAEVLLRPLLEDLFIEKGKTFKTEMDRAATQFEAKFKALPDTFTTIGPIEIDGGLLAMAPGWLVILLDYILADVILPGGFIFGAVIRYLLGKIPGLARFMPTAIVTSVLVRSVKTSLDEQFGQIKTDFARRIEASYEDIRGKLKEGFEIYMADELEPVIEVLSKPPAKDLDSDNIQSMLAQARQHESALSVAMA